MAGADVPAVLSIRFIFALLLMTALLPVLKIKLSFRGKPVFKLILLGIFQPVIYFIGESFGLKQTGIVVSSVMIALVPVLCQIFSALFLHEPPKLLQVVFCALSVGGVAVVTVQSSDGSGKTYLSGLIFLTVAVVSAVAFNILSRDLAKDRRGHILQDLCACCNALPTASHCKAARHSGIRYLDSVSWRSVQRVRISHG